MAENFTAKAWTVLESRVTCRDRWISIRTDDALDARGALVRDYHVFEYPDWVNVIPVLDDGRVLLAREYRHGVGAVVLGLVSGAMDAADEGAAEAAARRELFEEAGQAAERMTPVLTCFPNAASHNNRVFSFVAHGLSAQGAPVFETGEAVELVAAAPQDLLEAAQMGRIIMQAMHLAALYAGLHAGLMQPIRTEGAVVEPQALWPDALL